MTKTFQEINDAIEDTNLDPVTKNAFGFLVEVFAIDEIYDIEADAVEAMTDQLYQDKDNIISIIEAVTNLQTWVVVGTIHDGYNEMFVSRQLRASSSEKAQELFAEAVTDPDAEALGEKLDIDAVYGPF